MSRRAVVLVALVICLLVATAVLAATLRIPIYVDGEQVPADALLHNGRTYLPVRAIGECLGCEVQWDPDTKAVYITREGAADTRSPDQATMATEVEPPRTAQLTQQVAKKDLVHITNTGTKYHRAGCRYLSKSDIPIEQSDAIERGYEPCKVCKP